MVYGVENAFVVDISTDHRLIWILRLLGKCGRHDLFIGF
jgi:hypothetical protein